MKANAKFINTERIEGYVYSTGSNFNQLSERVAGEKSKNPGSKYIAGDLDVAVDEQGLNVITIHYRYVSPFVKGGQPSSTYAALKKIIDNPDKTWVTGGKDNAFKVQCTGVAIALNDFMAGDGTKVSAIRNENGFCSIINDFNGTADRNTFSADMYITKVTHVDADPDKNIPEDFTTVSGAVFGYGPVILPVSFVVRSKKGMEYFESLEPTPKAPIFTKVWGHINCMTIKVERKEESAFGEAAVQTYERKSREYVITGTAKVPYDFGSEEVLTEDDINKMNQNRQIMLAEIEQRFNEKQTTSAANGMNFGTGPQSAPVPEGKFVF